MENRIILFDGECGFCNRTILFLAEEDINDNILFISNKSKKGKSIILNNNNINDDLISKTIVLIKKNEIYTKSEVFINLIEEIPKIKNIKIIYKFIPVSILNFLYDLISNNRYKISSKSLNCKIPSRRIINKILIN